MKSFHSLVVLQRPPQVLWMILQDHLQDFAGDIADIESVRQIERSDDADGNVRIANEWRSRQQIPPSVKAALKLDAIGWIDRNTWSAGTRTCSWTIEPSVLGDYLTCAGETIFTETMAGRGTRVTLAGELDLKPGLMDALGGLASVGPGFIESVLGSIIPRNLRAVLEAAAAFEPPA